MNQIEIFSDSTILAHAVVKHFIEQARTAVETKKRFSVALAGGSTPQLSYQLLTKPEYKSQVDWSKIHIFWGDERCVPPDDNQSNFHMASKAFLDKVPIPTSNVYRMEGERKPSVAANRYQDFLVDFFGDNVQFDLVLLGMGADGHTASLFPGTEAVRKTSGFVTANYIEKLSTWRITLTPSAINNALNIAFLVAGGNKADTLHKVLKGKYIPDLYPSQIIKPLHGKLIWFIDKNASSLLDQKV
jgi:6-phosphogluconolactonase